MPKSLDAWEILGAQAAVARGHTGHVRSHGVAVCSWEHDCPSFTVLSTGLHTWRGLLGPKDLDINILEYNFAYLQFLHLN